MINNHKDAVEFQTEQKEVVAAIGAYISPIKEFLRSCENNILFADDINNIRRLQSDLSSKDLLLLVKNFLRKHDFNSYVIEIADPYNNFCALVAGQTIPRRKLENNIFIERLKSYYSIISDGMIVIAQIPLQKVDINIKAENPFQAFLFFNSLFSTVKTQIYVIDPYLDSSLFYRYLFALNKEVEIKIITNPKKWGNKIQSQFEAVEDLFKKEYLNYTRNDCEDIHDRFIITEIACYQLGGSLKDAAKNSDFSIVQLSEDRRKELISQYW